MHFVYPRRERERDKQGEREIGGERKKEIEWVREKRTERRTERWPSQTRDKREQWRRGNSGATGDWDNIRGGSKRGGKEIGNRKWRKSGKKGRNGEKDRTREGEQKRVRGRKGKKRKSKKKRVTSELLQYIPIADCIDKQVEEASCRAEKWK